MVGKSESQLDDLVLRLSSASGHFTAVINYNNNTEHLHNAYYTAKIS